MDKIRWIGSYPKSGNTWVRFFINAYLTGHLDINKVPYTEGDCAPSRYQDVANVPITEISPDILIQYRHAMLTNMLMAQKFRPLIMKTHHAQSTVYGVDLIPPYLSRKSVYIVRDPRQIAASLADHMQQPVDKAIDMMGYKDASLSLKSSIHHFLSSWSNHVESWTTHSKIPVRLIRYEDLKDDPERNFSGILEYFGIQLNLPRLKKAIRLCDIERLKVQEKKAGFREKFHKAQTFFDGKKAPLSSNQLARIEFDHGDVMTRLGYLGEKYHGDIQQVSGLRVASATGQS